ncbi:MAG: aminotransferase class V-fold PLP-dependent enzyme [Methanobacteriota archaeon]|nr:MAG: aminotransferase class V-fold PLP-dependent enzyme [Euryarchaeota archaeon]
MIEKIKELEKIARQLEPTPEQREAYLGPVLQYAERFLSQIYSLPAYVITEDMGKGIYESPISEKPISIHEILRLLEEHIDRPGLNPASGGHLGYIPGGGIFHSALGDFLADVTNRYAGVFFASPGAVRMENMLLKWMAQVVGYPADSAGNLTSGGSIANLIGIVSARDASGYTSKDYHRMVVYLTEQVHHSVDKALRIAGLADTIKRFIPVDNRFRMNVKVLDETIHSDKEKGLIPWLIIASAGTTDTGAVDPLREIGQISSNHHLWFHVDGAYGAFFALCDEGKKILQGMETSDSLVMDPHKGLFLPYGTGAVLVKDKQAMHNAHYYQANYMQDAMKYQEELAPADLSPELTKHFRGLRVWLPLKLLGVKPFRAALEEKLWLARYFYQQIKTIPGFEVGPYPDLSVVTYRYIPENGDANRFNQRLVEEVQKDGRVFISSTLLNGKFTLRLAVLAFRTHLDTIQQTIQILQEKVEWIKENG